MSVPPDQPADAAPLPVRVLLPNGEKVTGRLWARRQLRDGWLYQVGLPDYRNSPGEPVEVEAAEYRGWVRAAEHVRPVEGVSYDQVPTERLEVVEQLLGPQRPSGWVLVKSGGRGGPDRCVVHAVDCAEAPAGAPALTLDRVLDVAQQPGVRLCTLCGAAAGLAPVLQGFDRGFADEGWRPCAGRRQLAPIGLCDLGLPTAWLRWLAPSGRDSWHL
ncbi:DUF6233 domain-containing protein [Streptomyces sp. NPDC032161]|uniref:DUF6233 domain-containing protein n=1 Tax=unclassified Streptomyces TaxID=2593676 RepID=UPI00340E65F2